MEGNKQQKNTNQNPKNKSEKKSIKTDIKSNLNTTSNQTDRYYKTRKRRKIIQRKQYIEKWKEPLVVVTLILAFATFALYWEASNEGEISKKAADAAKESADASKATLDEYRKEFEQTNRPYVFLTNFKIDTTINRYLHCTFDAVNTGKFPATLKYMTVQFGFGNDTLHFYEVGNKNTAGQNEFLPFNGIFNFNELVILKTIPYKAVFLGNVSIFLSCDYEYVTDILNKEYKVHIVYKISFVNKEMNVDRVALSETFQKKQNQ